MTEVLLSRYGKELPTDDFSSTMHIAQVLLFLDQNVFSVLQNILTNPLVSHGLL